MDGISRGGSMDTLSRGCWMYALKRVIGWMR